MYSDMKVPVHRNPEYLELLTFVLILYLDIESGIVHADSDQVIVLNRAQLTL